MTFVTASPLGHSRSARARRSSAGSSVTAEWRRPRYAHLARDSVMESAERIAVSAADALVPRHRVVAPAKSSGAHGQGATPRETPDYVAAYALHLAAAKILFLVEAHKS